MLEKLQEVQQRDLELDALHEERERVPPELVELRQERKALETRLAERRYERDELDARVRAAESELQALGKRRRDASEAALRADGAKEAAQYQNQELQFATREQELEEDTLPLMEQLEELREKVNVLEEELAELVPRLEEQDRAEHERVSDVDRRLETLRVERDALAEEVPRNLLRPYEQVRKARRGVGLVEIADQRRCGGCNVQLPIHVIQKAKRGTSVVRCPNCGRILWAKD